MIKRMLLIASLGLAGVAYAQDIGNPVNVAFRLGFGYPIDDVTRAQVGNMIGFGGDYFFEKSLLGNTETYLSIDWLGKSLSGAKGNMFPLALNLRWYIGGDYYSANRTYFHLGAGVAIIDIFGTDSVAMVRSGIGVELGEHIFMEANFVYSDQGQGGVRATSGGLYLGYRY